MRVLPRGGSIIFHWGALENFGTANYILRSIALQGGAILFYREGGTSIFWGGQRGTSFFLRMQSQTDGPPPGKNDSSLTNILNNPKCCLLQITV